MLFDLKQDTPDNARLKTKAIKGGTSCKMHHLRTNIEQGNSVKRLAVEDNKIHKYHCPCPCRYCSVVFPSPINLQKHAKRWFSENDKPQKDCV